MSRLRESKSTEPYHLTVQSRWLKVLLIFAACFLGVFGASVSQHAQSNHAATIPVIGTQPKIIQTETNGFAHPSIGFSADSLALMQKEVKAGYDPWVSAFNDLANTSNAALDYQTRNQNPSDPTKPLYTDIAGDAQAREGKVDGAAAWSQTLMYLATGNNQFRQNAMTILRMWSQVRQKTSGFIDSHISTSEAIYPMVISVWRGHKMTLIISPIFLRVYGPRLGFITSIRDI